MKIYIIYHYTALELEDNIFQPSGIVYHTTDSLTNALCFMEDDDTDEQSWWKVESFTLNQIDDPESDFYNTHHIGWYSHKVIKLEFSPFFNILEKIYKNRGLNQ